MFTRVLVTGIQGSHAFVAERFIEFLRQQGVNFDAVLQPDAKAVRAYDAVVHFGGFGGSGNDYTADIAGTKQLLSALKQSKQVTRVVSVGTAAEYGSRSRAVSETTKPVPTTAYGKARLAQTTLLEKFAKTTRVKTLNLRLFNVAGVPKQKTAGSQTLFESLFEQFGNAFDGVIRISNKNTERDFVDLDDAVWAIWQALQTSKGGVYECINISSGKAVSIGAVVKMFAALCNRRYELEEQHATADSSIGTNAKAVRILGWRPTVSLKTSIDRVLSSRKRILVVGAGVASQKLIDEIKKEDRSDVFVIGLLDDDVSKHGTVVEGVPVIGSIADTARIVKKYSVAQVLVSAPSAQREVLRRVVELLPPGFPVKVLPSISSVILGTVDLNNIRDLDLADLIGRPLVKADQQRIALAARGKTFLVTGGAGSIGSEIVRQLYHSNAKKIIIIDSWEEGIYRLLEEFTGPSSSETVLHAYVGNVRDVERLEDIVSQHTIDVAIHAAAYKHVPIMEDNPDEAHKTNIGGTRNVLNLVVTHNIKDFLLISTDKAVNSVSVMGHTKRQAELLLKEYAERYPSHRFFAVRFGNVINSSGSVIPKFIRQIKSRLPVTVTHRHMTRYFMAIPEAVSLVLQSWIVAKNGQILVLDMGEQIRIMDLAETLIRLHGLEPHVDIKIQEIGMRKGERLREELLHETYSLQPTPIARVFVAEELLSAGNVAPVKKSKSKSRPR